MIKWLKRLFTVEGWGRDLTPEEWLDSVQGAIACNWQRPPWGNGIYSDERANQLWKWSLEEYERRKAGLPYVPPPAERKDAAREYDAEGKFVSQTPPIDKPSEPAP